MDIIYVKETSIPVDEMGARLEAAAKQHQFGVLNETDLRGKMQSKGVEFVPACKVFDVCNPHRAKVVLENKLHRVKNVGNEFRKTLKLVLTDNHNNRRSQAIGQKVNFRLTNKYLEVKNADHLKKRLTRKMYKSRLKIHLPD